MTEQNPWRTLSSRTIYRNSWIVLREDRVIRPDGAEGIYSVVEMRPSCGIVAINEDNQMRWMPFDDAVLSVMKGEITESVGVAGILKTELLRRSV